jgi:purine nucleoside phosphorylase
MLSFAKSCAKEVEIDLQEVSYAYWPLPQFETAAEI